jgi:predicted nucleic acid-binding protein
LPKYFLDTSALAKLYHHEAGSEYMDRILKEAGSQFIVSRLSIVEMESVLATKVRTKEIHQAGVDIARRRLRSDLVRGQLVVGPSILTRHYQVARTLLVKFGASEGLRTLDALQLAIALDLKTAHTRFSNYQLVRTRSWQWRPVLKQHGTVSLMVTADQRLCQIAPLGGCPAINPEKPGPVLI